MSSLEKIGYAFLLLFLFVVLLVPALKISTDTPTGFVPFAGFASPLFSMTSNQVSTADTITYKTGYYSTNGGAWTPFNLTGTAYAGSTSWLISGSATLPSFGTGEHYIIMYSCTALANNWDCHNGWQLIVVNALGNVQITTSDFELINPPSESFDGNLTENSRWSAEGTQWIQYDFATPITIDSVQVQFFSSATRTENYDVQVYSGNTWQNVFSGTSTLTASYQTVTFTSRSASAIRITGRGNNVTAWNSLVETRFLRNNVVVLGETTTPTPGTCTGTSTEPCTITNGVGSRTRTCNAGVWGAPYGTCTVVSCNANYFINGSICSPTTCLGSATQTCTDTIPHASSATQTRTCTNSVWSSYGTCTLISCITGYVQNGNACILTTVTPTCFDGILNQDETEIDCGGVCVACLEPGTSYVSPYLKEVIIPPYNANNPEHFLITTTNNGWRQINNPAYRYFYVAPGNYNSVDMNGDGYSDTILLTKSGTASAPRYISLYNGNDWHPAKLSVNQQATVQLTFDGSQYWIIDRLSTLNAPSSNAITINAKSKHLIFNRMYFNNFNNAFMIFGTSSDTDYTQNITIQNSRLYNMSDYGFDLDQSGIFLWAKDMTAYARIDDVFILNNEIVNCNDGIMLLRIQQGNSFPPANFQNIIIDGNHISVNKEIYTKGPDGNYPLGEWAKSENAIDLKAGSDNPQKPVVISHNYMWGYRKTDAEHGGSGSSGEIITGHYHTKNVIIQKNVLFDAPQGIAFSDPSGLPYSVENALISNNIIAQFTPYDGLWGSGETPLFFTATKGVTFEKNVIVGIGVSRNWMYNRYVSGDPQWAYPENFIVRNNVIISMSQRSSDFATNSIFTGNYHYNTPRLKTSDGTYDVSATVAQMEDLIFTTDIFTNNPRTITIKGVVSTSSSPHGTSVGLENVSSTTPTCTGSSTQSCTATILNAASATQTRTCTNGVWSGFGTCTLITCNNGYTKNGNDCILITTTLTLSFYGDWETGTLIGTGNHNWGIKQVVADDRYKILNDGGARQGNYYARVEVRPGDNPLSCCSGTSRSEVAVMRDANNKDISENESSGTVQYSFSVKFDSTWQPVVGSTKWALFLQLHGPDVLGASPLFGLGAIDKIGLSMLRGDISTPHWLSYDLSDGSLNKGQWIDFIVTVKYQKGPTGFIVIQRRNEGQTTFTEVLNLQNISTLQYSSAVNGGAVGNHYMKYGLYTNDQTFINVLYNDGFTRTVLSK
jgi:hypothetical protein